MNNKPIVVIPIGDPAGIGPEISVKSLLKQEIYDVCRPVLTGDENIVRHIIDDCKLNLKVNVLTNPKEGIYQLGTIDLVAVNNIDQSEFEYGKVSAMCGNAAFEYIKKTVELSDEGLVDSIATTPINKESLKAAKVPFIGHTEIYGNLSNTADPLTMFEIDKLRVLFLSRHVSLRQAIDMVKKERLIDYSIRSLKALERLGVTGRLAIAGLNPHSGEHGLFGDEEMTEIEPAVKELQDMGYDVIGPVPADSVFAQGLDGRYAAILSLYHDQGHIATKTYDFHRTISITNGMPFLRTSVDHGTAFDIAGKNIANPISMIEAIKLAAKYAVHFKK